jgi:hypothetical protein
MKTTEFKTFKVEVKDAQAWVTFDNPPDIDNQRNFETALMDLQEVE